MSFKFDIDKLASICKEIKRVKNDTSNHPEWNFQAIERSLILLDDKNSRAICLNTKGQSIFITAQSDTRGSIHEVINECEIEYKNDDSEMNIMVNAYYLHEVLKNIKV